MARNLDILVAMGVLVVAGVLAGGDVRIAVAILAVMGMHMVLGL